MASSRESKQNFPPSSSSPAQEADNVLLPNALHCGVCLWRSMDLLPAVFRAVKKKGYRMPTPIQRKCIPL